jgi:PII-like signaling protein
LVHGAVVIGGLLGFGDEMCLCRRDDRGGVPDLSVSEDNFDMVEDNPHDPTMTSEPEALMQSLNQLPVVTNLVDARSA